VRWKEFKKGNGGDLLRRRKEEIEKGGREIPPPKKLRGVLRSRAILAKERGGKRGSRTLLGEEPDYSKGEREKIFLLLGGVCVGGGKKGPELEIRKEKPGGSGHSKRKGRRRSSGESSSPKRL